MADFNAADFAGKVLELSAKNGSAADMVALCEGATHEQLCSVQTVLTDQVQTIKSAQRLLNIGCDKAILDDEIRKVLSRHGKTAQMVAGLGGVDAKGDVGTPGAGG